MRQVLYVMKFSGQAVFSGTSQQTISLKTTGLSNSVTTRITEEGVSSVLTPDPEGAAFLESTITMEGPQTFIQQGSISFGDDHDLNFTATGQGQFGPSVDPEHFHGSVTWRVTGGTGSLEGATGYITSNFTISSTGEVSDYQLGVLFVG